MPINYTVNADVIDISSDIPRSTDSFLVDTNVWYWMTYTRASQAPRPPQPHQTITYPSYISKALTAKSTLLRCGLSLAELAHIIEKCEREIYSKSNPPLKTKEFRHNRPVERSAVVTELQSVWAQVKGMATPIDVMIDDPITDSALSNYSSYLLDGYDLFLAELLSKAGIVQIITDDGDYASVPGIRVFTCNANVLQAAFQQSKLILRQTP